MNPPWKRCAGLPVIVALVSALSLYAQENPEVAPRAVPVAAGPNDVARFLAGMPVPERKAAVFPGCGSITPTINQANRKRSIILPPIFLTAVSRRLPVS